MKRTIITSVLLLGLLSSCLDKAHLEPSRDLGFRNEPQWVLPAVYGQASLKDIIIGQDEDKKSKIVVDEHGVLKLHNRLPSVYRISLAELVAPEKTKVERELVLPPLDPNLAPNILLEAAKNLPILTGELEIPLPKEVKEIKYFEGSTRLDLVIPETYPIEADYEITFPTVSLDGKPLVIQLTNPDAQGRYTAQLNHFIVEAEQKNNIVRLPYNIRVIAKEARQGGTGGELRALVRLSDIKGHIFKGKISDQTDVEIEQPVSFDYDNWPKIEDLAIQGSRVSVEAKHRGRIGLGLKCRVSVTGKGGRKHTLTPSIPLLEMDAIDQEKILTKAFSGEDIDQILSFLSDLGVSIEGLSIDFTNKEVYIDEDSFIDLSLVLDIPLHLKFSRVPVEFNFKAPSLEGETLDKKDDAGINRVSLSLKTLSSLPLGIEIKGLTLLDTEERPIDGGFIGFDFKVKHSPDGNAVKSMQEIKISREQIALLSKAKYVRFEGAAVSSGEWMQLRPEQSIGFSLAILTNE
ncbi:MAG: hypothetical protein Q4A61_01455 [Porphyromonadaceae bacterium]|nr:hypothetical protein [Porphyromonadaceae bacterium]